VLTSAASSPGSNEVTWQVAFFALVPLVLGTMTQPVGRVMDSEPELRFWLRSSPIFCIGDMLYFLLRVAIDHILEPTWSWRHFKAELYHRFRDEKWSEASNEVEKAALGRWILILLGAVPCQTIKLMAMRGIPKTQTLAMMYFISMILGEILNITAEASFRQIPAESVGRQHLLSESKPTWHGLFKKTCYIFQLGLTMQSLALVVQPLSLFNDPANPNDFYAWCMTYSILAIMSMMFWKRPAISELEETLGFNYFSHFYIMTALPLIHISHLSFDNYVSKLTQDLTPLRDTLVVIPYVLIIVVVAGLLGEISLIVWRLSLLWMEWLSKIRFGQIMGIPATRLEANHLMVFLINVTVSLCCYAYLFNGTGTANPSWVGVFG
jgi:hypothetical protein